MPSPKPAVQSAILPFDEAIEFFRQKLDLESASWTETYGREHDHAFVVAGANTRALVEDFRQAVDQAVSQRTGYDEFRKQFASIVKKHGWSYNGSEGWRSRVIYQTNLQQAYNAGRYAQLKKIAHRRPYWQYHHSQLVREPRLDHLKWDGLLIHHEDTWWETHFPANGWGCKCWVTSHRASDFDRLGKRDVDKAPPNDPQSVTIGQRGPYSRTVTVPKGVDPGFEHTPGRSWLQAMTPRLSEQPPIIARPGAIPPPPLPQPVIDAPEALPESWADAEHQRWFNDLLGGQGRDAFVFRDAAGDYLPISGELFGDGLSPEQRRWLPAMGTALASPDEIWLDWRDDGGAARLVRRYVLRFADSDQVSVVEIDGPRLYHRNLITAAADALRSGLLYYLRPTLD